MSHWQRLIQLKIPQAQVVQAETIYSRTRAILDLYVNLIESAQGAW